MAVTTDIAVLLKFFASKQNSALVNYHEFVEYIRRYAQYHCEAQPELEKYISNTAEQLRDELAKLTDSRQICIVSPTAESRTIVVIGFLIDKYAARYKEIEASGSKMPFPVAADLPRKIPAEKILEMRSCTELLVSLLDEEDLSSQKLYGITFSNDLAVILLPSSVSAQRLVTLALKKVRLMLNKDEFHDYFLKKLVISNPGKEISVKNSFTHFVDNPDDALEVMKNSNDSYYFWSQLCFYIKQDYEKVTDFTAEDIALLQSVHIIEVASNYYRNKAQQEYQRSVALKNLSQLLAKPPYYFTYDDITRFTDSRGIPLLGQYTQADLNEYLEDITTTARAGELPEVLTFKVEPDKHYYISKQRVVSLVLRLCSDAHDTIRHTVTQEWFKALKNFDTLPEMSDQQVFEKKLSEVLKSTSPVLYALLHASFLAIVNNETQESQMPGAARLNLFYHGELLPYSDLLMLSRQELLTDARILLPFWYTIPFLSSIVGFFLHHSKRESKKAAKKEKKVVPYQQADDLMPVVDNKTARRLDFKRAAAALEEQLVPANSSLDRELAAYLSQWNKLINRDISDNLTEDVNSFIRDYMRRVLRTLPASHFTRDRVHELAETLVKTPGMQKIRDHDQLSMYIELYIVKLVKNL